MVGVNTYVQQLAFNGKTYTKGSVVDLFSKFSIVAQDFPFKKFPEAKDLPTRDWAGEDGADVYIPKNIPMKHYEIEVLFLCTGTKDTIRKNITDFIDYICGRDENAVGGRLAIYNEHTGIGRKDVVVSKIDNELFFVESSDPDAVARFRVKFWVYDPVTDVVPIYTQGNEGVSNLYFAENEQENNAGTD